MITELTHAGPGGGSLVVPVTGVSSGADLLVAVAQPSTAARTYTVSSNVGGALASVVPYNPRGFTGVFRLKAAASGAHTITITANTGSTNVWAWVFEATGLDQSAAALTPTGGGYTDPAVTDNHLSAPSGEIVIPGDGVAISIGVVGASIGTTTAGIGWTKATAPSNVQAFCQYRTVTASTNQGDWTTSATDRVAEATMAVFLYATGGGGGGSTWGTTGALGIIGL